MKNILIVDDHEIVRHGLKSLIAEIYKGSKMFEAGNEVLAIESLKKKLL